MKNIVTKEETDVVVRFLGELIEEIVLPTMTFFLGMMLIALMYSYIAR